MLCTIDVNVVLVVSSKERQSCFTERDVLAVINYMLRHALGPTSRPTGAVSGRRPLQMILSG